MLFIHFLCDKCDKSQKVDLTSLRAKTLPNIPLGCLGVLDVIYTLSSNIITPPLVVLEGLTNRRWNIAFNTFFESVRCLTNLRFVSQSNKSFAFFQILCVANQILTSHTEKAKTSNTPWHPFGMFGSVLALSDVMRSVTSQSDVSSSICNSESVRRDVIEDL